MMTETAAESVVHWLETFAEAVREIDFAAGKSLCAREIVSFGTVAQFVEGLDDLVSEQWEHIWPHTREFRFEPGSIRITVGPGECMASAAAQWSSLGVAKDGRQYRRSGRATIVLRRERPEQPWKAVHTHFSMSHGSVPNGVVQ